MFSRLFNKAKPEPKPWFKDPKQNLERMESASETNRLTKAHWSKAHDQSVNSIIRDYLKTVRGRCRFECRENGFVEGVVSTHCSDIIGSHGPTLQIQTENSEYSAVLEAIWNEWSADCDMSGKLSLVELLDLWVRGLWLDGEFLAQEVMANDANSSGISYRINNIATRRLETPFSGVDHEVVEGVKFDKYGRPLEFYITEPDHLLALTNPQAKVITADQVIHEFRMLETGQARGIPWLAPVLQVIADMRDFDQEVLEAQRMAAQWAVALYTDHPDADYVEVSESQKIKRASYTTMPPGWRAEMIDPKQPSTQYLDYRGERLRELGRPVGMPLMMVRLDSQKHSYSSARFDGQIYNRNNRKIQGWLERRALNRMLLRVEREAQLKGLIPPDVTAGMKIVWTWPAPPHVDPGKEAKADTENLKNGTTSAIRVCASRGVDYDDVVAERARGREIRIAHGFPADEEIPATLSLVSDDDDDDNESNNTGDNDAKSTADKDTA